MTTTARSSRRRILIVTGATCGALAAIAAALILVAPSSCHGCRGRRLSAPPRLVAAPAIRGTVRAGHLLTASTGTWRGKALSISYEWSRCDVSHHRCSAIPDARRAIYRIGALDVGHTILVTITAANSSGSARATSLGVVPVTESPAQPGCLPRPSSCGYPDASNTGIAGCPALTRQPGFTASMPGATYSDIDVSGTVTVTAPDVTLNCVRITDSHPSDNNGYVLTLEGTNTVVAHTEVNGLGGEQDACIEAGGATLDYVDVHGCVDGVHMAWNVIIENSYIHDNRTSIPSPHMDGLQWIGCSTCANVPADWRDEVRHNTIYPGRGDGSPWTNSAVFVQAADGPVSGVTIDNNLLDGGGYTVFDNSQNGYPTPSNVVLTDNRFGTRAHFGTGDLQAPAPSFTGNVWDATGRPMPAG